MFYAIAVVAVMWVIWNRTTLGKNMFAIGGNREAAKVCGVNVKRTIIIVYIIAGLLYAFGGVLKQAVPVLPTPPWVLTTPWTPSRPALWVVSP